MRYIKLLMLSFFVVAFAACDEEDYFEGTTDLRKPEVVISFPDGGGFEPFGQTVDTTQTDFTVNVEVSGPQAAQVTSLQVTTSESGGPVESIAISDGKGTFSGTLADYGLNAENDNVVLVFTESATPSSKNFDITVVAPPVPEAP
ncbi:hypothetical protein [Persicobacter psychrovividus]|uniref:DUF4843 domain-containing protein n=1 Tax=Persicobacter psychrovividus TaxID=387638 RepID=A0ABM7VEV2_9BACT|nr:hypothetical protein PEPS_17370 [Persicobacter psychrovividus]